MKIMNNTSLNTYFKLVAMIFILITNSGSKVSAVTYQFNEDFENPDTNLWEFWANDFRNFSSFVEIGSSLSIQDGWLSSNTSYDGYKEDVAELQDNTAFGAWSLDVYISSSSQKSEYFTNRFFALVLNELPFPKYSNEPNTNFYGSFGVGFYSDTLDLTFYNSTSSNKGGGNVPYELIMDQFQHYDLIRTENHFYIFVDQTMVMNKSVSSEFNLAPKITNLSFSITYGSNIRFDNIKITNDAEGRLAELSPAESSNNAIYFVIGGVILAIIGIYYWSSIKKKN